MNTFPPEYLSLESWKTAAYMAGTPRPIVYTEHLS
jgi:hypothetical protein